MLCPECIFVVTLQYQTIQIGNFFGNYYNSWSFLVKMWIFEPQGPHHQTQTQTQIVYFNNQHFMYTIDHNIKFIWSIVQEWLIFGDGDPFAFTDGDD